MKNETTNLCYYYVKFRVIRPDDAHTPLMFLPLENIKVEYKSGVTDGYMLSNIVGKELEINPNYIRVEAFQPSNY